MGPHSGQLYRIPAFCPSVHILDRSLTLHNNIYIAKNQDAIMKAGVMDGLVAMVMSPSDLVKMNALASLANLCQDKREFTPK